jgi:hypothetical protein
MSASTRRSAVRLAAAFLLVALVAGCAGQAEESTAPAQATTATTVAPTTTTVPPLTAKEAAWLKAIPKVAKKVDKVVTTTTNLTISGMLKLANALRTCSRELARGGSPSDRLEPVYVLVKKACREYDKGATCFSTAASLGITFAGSAHDRKQTKAIKCGLAAQEMAFRPLDSAETLSLGIQSSAG